MSDVSCKPPVYATCQARAISVTRSRQCRPLRVKDCLLVTCLAVDDPSDPFPTAIAFINVNLVHSRGMADMAGDALLPSCQGQALLK